MDAVQRALNNWGMIQQAAGQNGVDPTILAAIGIRESGFQNVHEQGGGLGMGVFQIDAGAFPGAQMAAVANSPTKAANFAAGLIGGYYRNNIFKGYSPVMSLGMAIRSYNAGPGGLTPLLGNTGYTGYLDIGTAHGNYVSNVAAIATYCF
jgi:soluble lytic murein transglycosylase-like protein